MSVVAQKRKREPIDAGPFHDRLDRPDTHLSEIFPRSISEGYMPKMGNRRATKHTYDIAQSSTTQNDSYLNSLPFSLSASCRTSLGRESSRESSRRTFDLNASIALVGISGSGKSSLAVILSRATGRRLVDADQYFQKVTGLSRSQYIRKHSVALYRREETRILSLMLTDHPDGSVIACGPGSMEYSGQQFLKQYLKTHPVIHIIRDLDSIQQYLGVCDKKRVQRLMEIAAPIHRSCSNLEFFNVSETNFQVFLDRDDIRNSLIQSSSFHGNTNQAPSLTLKCVERDFLHFVAFATGNKSELMRLHSSFPLSLVPIESRQYTYTISVALSSLFGKGLNVEELESTCDAFEIRIDEIATLSPDLTLADNIAEYISQVLAVVRRNIIVPIIYHVQPWSSQGEESPSCRRPDHEYLQLVEHGLQLAPEFITIDLSYSERILKRIISVKGSTRVIGHYSSQHPTTNGWDDEEYMAKYEFALKLGCDMVRLSRTAFTIDDNFAVERFRHRMRTSFTSKIPVIAYNSGPLGRLSLCFNPILTPVTHYSIRTSGLTQEDTCITAQEAQAALFSSFVLDPLKFYVFGANSMYSLSPAMHNAAYKACGMPHEYRVHEASSLRGLSTLVQDPHWGGCSVGLPYKTEVIPLLHSMSCHARAIGAVNTLIPIRTMAAYDGKENSLHLERNRAGQVMGIYGDNTDWIGIYRCLRRGLSPANSVRVSSTGLVIGAGGMARAAIYAMQHIGIQNIFLYNRTAANAEKLGKHYNQQSGTKTKIHVLKCLEDAWPKEYRPPTLVTSCIPAHSIGGVPAPNFEIPLPWLGSPTGGVVVELAYKPLNTPLIKQIRGFSGRGWVAVDGLDVLPEQGFAQFELLTGRRAPRKLMRAVVLKEYRGDEGQHDPQFPQLIESRIENIGGHD